MKGILYLLQFILLCNFCKSLRILGVFPTWTKSHYNVGAPLMKKLAWEGHEVVMLSPFYEDVPHPNYDQIVMDGFIEKFQNQKSFPIDVLLYQDEHLWTNIYTIYTLGDFLTRETLGHPKVRKLIQSDAEFDVVVVEIFMSEALIGFGSHFRAPVVGVNTFGTHNWINNVLGNPAQSSVVSHPYSKTTNHMTFFERVHSLLFNAYDWLLLNYVSYPIQKEAYDAGFPDPKPDFHTQIKHGVSLAFVNSHFSITGTKAALPNLIEIGGASVKRDTDPLSEDLQEYLDSADDGAVFFSLGSLVVPSALPLEMQQTIFNTFIKFPHIKFLWKHDNFQQTLPDNILIQNWFPQNDILAHPNIRCFMTHGGLVSVTETVYHAVPVIGIPVFADQNANMARATRDGYGLTVAYKNVTEESLTWALTEMLTTNRYKDAAVQVSRRFRDQPMDPLNLMTYWVEYIARHKGAPFLRSAAQDLNFWQYIMLDVVAFLVGVTIGLYWLVVVVMWIVKSLKPKKAVQKYKKFE